jgi:AcrR family transcriptional regulator
VSTRDAGLPIWARPEPGSRRPRFSRDQIAATALEIADRDGFEAVSMRRIAAVLGAAPMTLYHYVRTKDDLIALMDDALMAELLVAPGELPEDWRAALAEISRRTRRMILAHPWALVSMQESQLGPNAMRHFEQSLAAVSGTGLDTADRVGLVSVVDDYVFGNALHTSESLKRAAMAAANPGMVKALMEVGMALLQSGEFPQIAELAAGADPGNPEASAPGLPMNEEGLAAQFERGLQAVLDGAAAAFGLRGSTGTR